MTPAVPVVAGRFKFELRLSVPPDTLPNAPEKVPLKKFPALLNVLMPAKTFPLLKVCDALLGGGAIVSFAPAEYSLPAFCTVRLATAPLETVAVITALEPLISLTVTAGAAV